MIKNDTAEDALIARKSGFQGLSSGEGSDQHLASLGGNFTGNFSGPPREDLGFREFWRSLERHKLALLTVVITITSIATVLILRAQTTYLASTVLVLATDNPTLMRAGEMMLRNDESDATTATAIKTKMVMMKSHELLEDVIVNLQFDHNEKFLDGITDGPLSRLLNLGRDTTPPVAEHPGEHSGEVSAVSVAAEKETGRSAHERARLDPLVRAVESSLNVEQIKETRALKVSFIHTDPEIAAAVADGVAQHFIQRNFQSKTERFTNAASWLNQSTLELKRRMEKAEQALANYTRANNIFTVEGASTLTAEKLAKLHDQATRAEADRTIKETLYQEVNLGRVAEVPEVFAEMTSKSPSAPRIVDLQKKLGELTTNEAQLSVHFGPSNPQLQEVREQISAVKEQIEAGRKALNDKLRAEYEHSVLQEQSLKQALAVAKAEAVDENQAAIQYNILKQEVETAKALYTEFLQKSNQSKIQVAEQYSSIHIIDHAKVPSVAYGPRRALNLLLWFTVSVLAGVGLAMLLEFLDNTIKNSDDVAQFLHLTTLAVIPRFKKINYQLPGKSEDSQTNGGTALVKQKKPLIALGGASASHQDRMMAAEAYHALRTSVLLSTAEGPPKTVLITSSKPGDGKTTTVINLAFSLCELDARVLVIDADLRRPTAHQILGVNRSLGLSTYLSRGATASDLIQHLSRPRLSFLPSGPIPPNPASLLSSPKMKSLLQSLSNEYDYILIDSPPSGGFSDTAILSTLVDGVVLVVQGSKNRRDMVRRVKNDLSRLGARIIGVVLNNVRQNNTAYSDYADTRYFVKHEESREV